MIDNKYAYETTLELDKEYLIELTKRYTSGDLKNHQRKVDLDPYLKSIREQFPILSPVWNVYDFIGNWILPTHIDAKRQAAFNIPLIGGEFSNTCFYVETGHNERKYDDKKVVYWINENIKEDFKFTLTRPTLIDNSVPHSVINGPSRRLIISWSTIDGVSFEEAKEYFKQRL